MPTKREAIQRHASFFLSVVQGAADEFQRGGNSQRAGLTHFDREDQNIVQAFQTLRKHHHPAFDQLLVDFLRRGSLLALRVPPSIYKGWLKTGLGAARRLKDLHAEDVLLSNLGAVAQQLGEMRSAFYFHRKTLALDERLGDHKRQAQTWGDLGNCYRYVGDIGQAIECYSRQLSIARGIANRMGEYTALNNLGGTYLDIEDYERARETLNLALELARTEQDRHSEGLVLGNLGQLVAKTGDHIHAIEILRERVEIAEQLGDTLGEAAGRSNLGWIAYEVESKDLAITLTEQALSLYRQAEDHDGICKALLNLGDYYLETEEVEKAFACYREAMVLQSVAENQSGLVSIYTSLVIAYFIYGMDETAEEFIQTTLKKVRHIKSPLVRATTYKDLANILYRVGQSERSNRYMRLAIKYYERISPGSALQAQSTLDERLKTKADLGSPIS